MRYLSIGGAVLGALGLLIVFKGLSYSREESVFKLGEFEAKVEQKRQVPQWLGGVALGAGVVLVVVGLRKR
ncbi:MAG: hypothetical protein EHM84_00095 [Lysobacterales bacterium]|jgi:hypothetical protein|nr:MAG: hypothetical protein EHM84_00095 [Xanthomonadales bacterium]